MLTGDFSTDNADNNVLCPNGFSSTAQGNLVQQPGRDDPCRMAPRLLPDAGTTGSIIPSQYIDPGAKALASFWPKANANPNTTPGGYNYVAPVQAPNDGWVYRIRMDYNLNDSNKFYISYQQAYSSTLAQGNGAHIYWTPGNSIPAPGGGLVGQVFTKSISGHFVHTFNSSTTNEFIAAWGFGSFPFGPPNPNAETKSTLGYTYGSIFNASTHVPAYSSRWKLHLPRLLARRLV